MEISARFTRKDREPRTLPSLTTTSQSDIIQATMTNYGLKPIIPPSLLAQESSGLRTCTLGLVC